jgi:hypothetical protein
VTTCEEESWDRGSGDGGGGSEASGFVSCDLEVEVRLLLLIEVDLLMPLSPDLGGSKHAARSTLVTEGCLSGSVCTAARDTRDTCDSSA